MATSTPLPNSFTGANTNFPNQGIHTLVGTIVKFRKQLTVRQEFKQQSGWNNELNRFLQHGLLELDKTVRRITYNPIPNSASATGKPDGAAALDDLKAKAADTARTLDQDFNASSLRADDVLMPSQPAQPIVHQLDGSDPNIPQVTPEEFPNDHGRLFIAGVDQLLVMATRLDARFDPTFITKYESIMLGSHLEKLWAITKIYGGEVNRTDTPTGTLPADEPQTFLGGVKLGAQANP